MPFCGTLDPENRLVLFPSLMPWEELLERCTLRFRPTTGASTEHVGIAFGELFIRQRLGLTDEDTVEQILENAYMQCCHGVVGYSNNAQFDPLMMVHFCRRFSEEDLNQINELITERDKAMVLKVVATLPDDDDSVDPDAGLGQSDFTCRFREAGRFARGEELGNTHHRCLLHASRYYLSD